jgi:PRC-barrel domain
MIAGGKGRWMSCPDFVAVRLPGRQMRERCRVAAAMALIALSVTINSAVQDSLTAQEVRSTIDEGMGPIVNVIVDRTGQVKAAVIEFGGFLGVGSRKIAVAWNALHFFPDAKKGARAMLELTRDQVRAAPEFREGKPVVVLGVSGLESLPFP